MNQHLVDELSTVGAPLILVVDDSPDSLELISTELIKYFEVHVAINGERCLELSSRVRRPDLILLDVVMPGMDGFEVSRKLKLDYRTKDIPFIFITAIDEVKNKTVGFELGAIDYSDSSGINGNSLYSLWQLFNANNDLPENSISAINDNKLVSNITLANVSKSVDNFIKLNTLYD